MIVDLWKMAPIKLAIFGYLRKLIAVALQRLQRRRKLIRLNIFFKSYFMVQFTYES